MRFVNISGKLINKTVVHYCCHRLSTDMPTYADTLGNSGLKLRYYFIISLPPDANARVIERSY